MEFYERQGKYEMKTISVVIPTYNEEENIERVYSRIQDVFQQKLQDYDYKILFIDNCSKDSSKKIIRSLALKDNRVSYIFNAKNFGFSRSTFYALTQARGDCAILLFADMQDPPEIMVDFVREWENGYKVVAGVKSSSLEKKGMYFIRSCYYKLIRKISEVEHIEHFTGFGLYDQSVIKIFRNLHDPLPYLRGIVAELAPECKRVYYEQQQRKYGKSSFNFIRNYDVAMLGITSYSKIFMRIATFGGIFVATVSFIIAVVTFFLKIFNIIDYPIGAAATLFGVFFIGSVQLIFTGVLGEYISNINIRTMDRPLVVEEERFNV